MPNRVLENAQARPEDPSPSLTLVIYESKTCLGDARKLLSELKTKLPQSVDGAVKPDDPYIADTLGWQ